MTPPYRAGHVFRDRLIGRQRCLACCRWATRASKISPILISGDVIYTDVTSGTELKCGITEEG